MGSNTYATDPAEATEKLRKAMDDLTTKAPAAADDTPDVTPMPEVDEATEPVDEKA